MMEYFKHHKWASLIILGVGGLIFFMIVKGGGGSSVVNSSSGLSSAQVAANAQLQAAQIGAQAHAQDTAAAVSIAGLQVQGQIDMATIAAGVANGRTAASQVVDLATLDAHTKDSAFTLAGIKAQLDSQNHANDLSYYATTNQQNIGYNEAQIRANTQNTEDAFRYQLDYAQASANLGMQNKTLDILNSVLTKKAA